MCTSHTHTHTHGWARTRASYSISIKRLHAEHIFSWAFCILEPHLFFRVGAEGSQPSRPDYGDTAVVYNPLSFIDIIHMEITLGPIVHPLHFQILAESSDKCSGPIGDVRLVMNNIQYVQSYYANRIPVN